MHRLIDRGIIATVNGIVSIGKEAVVLHADGGDIVTKDLEPILNETNKDIACDRIPKECAIKVFLQFVEDIACDRIPKECAIKVFFVQFVENVDCAVWVCVLGTILFLF